MKRQWYRSTLTKGILIIIELVLAAALVVSWLWLSAYPVLRDEVLEGEMPQTYEDTARFLDDVENISIEVLEGIGRRELFETNGVYDPGKLIDIQRFLEGMEDYEGNFTGLAYRLGDLCEWGEQWVREGYDPYANGGNIEDNIIVCKKSDETYHYYYYSEFVRMIDNGELKFVIVTDDSGISESDILAGLRDGRLENASDAAFKGLQDMEGRVVYIDCWSYDGNWIEEQYPLADGQSIMQAANDNPVWNGRLNDIYEMLGNAVYIMGDQKISYDKMGESYQEGDTNFAYLYADTQTGQVYTNRREFVNYARLEKSLEQFEKMGKYVIVRPELEGFESNVEGISAQVWRGQVKSLRGEKSRFVYAVGVDTEYPIKDVFYTEAHTYEKYMPAVYLMCGVGILSAVLFFVVLVWLTAAAGRSSLDEGLYLNWFDKWKTEPAAFLVIFLWAAPMAVLALGTGGLVLTDVSYFYDGARIYGNMLYEAGIGGFAAVYTCGMFLAGYLSLIRRIKAGTLWKNSLLRSLFAFVKIVFGNLHAVWKAVMVFGVFVAVHWLAVMRNGSGTAILLMFAGEAAIFFYLIRQAVGRQRIDTGVEKIAGGEVDYKIPLNGMGAEQRSIAEKINSIGQGLDTALAESVKSERLKTDLITNVSHDIKTPLTSIINYVSLLKQEDFEDPKLRRYVEVLEEKSLRLKTLTEDVVEASKISSGNITLEYMDINFVEMIQQTSGEFEEKFKARELLEVMTLPKEDVIIHVDGRQMWRILANIYNNASKYAMKGTRVYADLYTAEHSAVFSLKNISDQPLNIPAEELTERFIRGDISRGTEGSGLGLSIARTLTEMQGGRFELYLDGDLFRVTITFPLKS